MFNDPKQKVSEPQSAVLKVLFDALDERDIEAGIEEEA